MTYPEAPRRGLVEELHGHRVPDPYRWLEDPDDPATKDWSAAQDELARGVLDALPGRDTLAGRLTSLLRHDSVERPPERAFHRVADVRFDLPFEIGDYTDFYASIHHAANVGKLFRPDNPLLPNYRHIPIAYHGRASSVVLSGRRVKRPAGQLGEGRFEPTARD